MKRPMVWFSLMFLAGELMRLAGLRLWQASIIILLCIMMTGSRKAYFRVTWIRHLLPVFILAGFVVCSVSLNGVSPDEGLLKKRYVSFYGRITMADEKENSYAVEIGSCRLTGDTEAADSGPGRHLQGVLVYVDKDVGRKLYAGACISGRGRITLPERAANPGQFDARRYQASKGICYIIFPDELKTVREAPLFRRQVEDFRRHVRRVFDSLFDETGAGLLDAMILGDRSCIEADTRDIYRKLGIVHILAISGMHLSLVGRGLYKGLKKTGLPARPCALFAAFAVMTYARFVHAGPATMRAVIMFCMMMLAEYLGRKYDGLSAMALAGLLILIRHPLALWQSGFCFAFIAVLSLYLLYPSVDRLLHFPKKSRRLKLLYLIGPPAAVSLGTLPMTVCCYGEIPVFGLAVNLIALPLMGLLMPLGIMTGLSGIFSLSLSAFFAGSLRLLLHLYTVPRFLKPMQSHLVIKTGCQPLWMALAVYAVLAVFLILTAYTGYKKPQLLLMLSAALLLFVPVRKFGQLTAFLDVGQGQCIFIRSDDGRTMLYDGGSSDVGQVGKYRIIPFLDYYGVDVVDAVFISHGDYDHYSGALELLEASRVRHLYLTAAGKEDEGNALLAQMAAENAIPVTYVKAGDGWQMENVKISCIYPGESAGAGDINDRSMVLHVAAGSYDLLLTGDISSEAEEHLLGAGLSDADILQVPHHGSRFSSSAGFLEAVSPEAAVVSAGEGNRYGHPDQETLQRLKNAKSRTYITFKCGAVLIRPDAEGFRIRAFLPDG